MTDAHEMRFFRDLTDEQRLIALGAMGFDDATLAEATTIGAQRHLLRFARRATGIPASTLAGLRDGSLVAVPREPTDAMLLHGWLQLPRLRPDTGYLVGVYRAMLAAAPAPKGGDHG